MPTPAGVAPPVTELFCEEARTASDTVDALTDAGGLLYGFAGQTNSTRLLVRWRQGEIQFYRGELIAPAKLARAFAAGSH